MINVMIYLENTHDAEELVSVLLRKQLIASATIDLNNISYVIEGDQIIQNNYNVITAQSKSLLFSEVVKFVEYQYGKHIPIISIPIIGSNSTFNEFITTKTLKI